MKTNPHHWQDLRKLRNAFNSAAMESMEPLSVKDARRIAREMARHLGCVFHLSEIESMRVIASHDMVSSYVANEYESGKSLDEAREGAARFEAMREGIVAPEKPAPVVATVKSAILAALTLGARVTLTAPGYGNNPLTLRNGEVVLADGSVELEHLFAIATEGGPIAASWGVEISIKF